MTNILLAPPKLSGSIRETVFYDPMTIGQTRPILLIGHSDTDFQQTPYHVASMQQAVNWLKADSSSPLLRALLEAYNAGCRNIWLFSAAPMSEYVSDISSRNITKAEFGNKTFYEKYYDRLEAAYQLLSEYDTFEIVVPVEASFSQTRLVDFTTQLSNFCANTFEKTSNQPMGVIGTRARAYDSGFVREIFGTPLTVTIQSEYYPLLDDYGDPILDDYGDPVLAAVEQPHKELLLDNYGNPIYVGNPEFYGPLTTSTGDPILDSNGNPIYVGDTLYNKMSDIGQIGRNIMVVIGEGIVISRQMSRTYSASYAVQVGALLSVVPLSRSIFGIRFSNMAGLAGNGFSAEDIDKLTQAKLNPVVRTQTGKRGRSFETMLVTDNSLALDSSDYWSINQTRLVSACANDLKKYGEAYIGTTAKDSFKQVIYDYFRRLQRTNQIKDFSLAVQFVPRSGKATIDVGLMPVFGVRNVYFTVESGPGS